MSRLTHFRRCALFLALTLLFPLAVFAAGRIETVVVNGVTADVFIPEVPPSLRSADGDGIGGGQPVIVLEDPNPGTRALHVPAPETTHAFPRGAAASFSINYIAAGGQDAYGQTCQTFPEEARAVFNAAGAIWSGLLNSAVPIVINACWADLGSTLTLGYSGSQSTRDFTGAPRSNTWYSFALANALSGTRLYAGYADMNITYNANYTWYYGTDGNTPSDKIDLLSVVLHEIGHGLNFAGMASYSNGTGTLGSSGYPNAYDVYVSDASARKLTNTSVYPNPSTTLGSAFTSGGLYFDGSNATAANGGSAAKIYAPPTWMQGSSYSHLDYATYVGTANALMVYAIAKGVSRHDPGPVTKGMLKDMGWVVAAPACSYVVSSLDTFTGAGGSQTVTVTASASSCAWTASAGGLSWVHLSASGGTGSGTVTVSADQNTTNASRSGQITIAGQTLGVSQEAGSPCPAGTGRLQMNITPDAAAAARPGFCLSPGGNCYGYIDPGDTLCVTANTYTVTFNPISGWTTPANTTVVVPSGQTALISGHYVAVTATGALHVVIEPASLASTATWRLDGGATAYATGATVSGLSVGAHTVAFSPVAGWRTPAQQTVTVVSGEVAQVTGRYGRPAFPGSLLLLQ